MKYMGSKRAMLQNGLGNLLRTEGEKHSRVVDLFCGGASVAWFAAQEISRPVFAVDLQAYAAVLAEAVVGRTAPVPAGELEKAWLSRVEHCRSKNRLWVAAQELDQGRRNTATWSMRARELTAQSMRAWPIWNAYAGHYFSPSQAITLDAMLKSLPQENTSRLICLAATIVSASHCVASPGHTAQPFQPTRTAAPYLREAWLRDPFKHAIEALRDLCGRHARVPGSAVVGDAVAAAYMLHEGDLVFVDPPYSGVHYSRFYHVLETIARRSCGPVDGIGRYPPPEERPVSSFSRKGESVSVLRRLLLVLAERRCTVILTFPSGVCSNGLSGKVVVDLADRLFRVEVKSVNTRFSTLGGNNAHRNARQMTRELILLMHGR